MTGATPTALPSTPAEALDLDAIEARANMATPGPWWAWDRGVGWHIACGPRDERGLPELLPEGHRTDLARREDAEFIAAARQDVPALVALVRRVTAERDMLQVALNDWTAWAARNGIQAPAECVMAAENDRRSTRTTDRGPAERTVGVGSLDLPPTISEQLRLAARYIHCIGRPEDWQARDALADRLAELADRAEAPAVAIVDPDAMAPAERTSYDDLLEGLVTTRGYLQTTIERLEQNDREIPRLRRELDAARPTVPGPADVDAARLAEERQRLAHEGTGYIPAWGELTDHERAMSTLEAGNWLKAFARAVRVAEDPAPTALDEAAHSVWLHGNWRWLTRNMATEEREAFSDAVDRVHARNNADDPELNLSPVDRWWRSDGPLSSMPPETEASRG